MALVRFCCLVRARMLCAVGVPLDDGEDDGDDVEEPPLPVLLDEEPHAARVSASAQQMSAALQDT